MIIQPSTTYEVREDMAEDTSGKPKVSQIDLRRLSVIVFSLFFAWLLAFPFEGQVLYALADYYRVSLNQLVFGAVAAHFVGLLLCGLLIRTMKAARTLLLCSVILCITASVGFFFPPSLIWTVGLIASSLFSGASVAAWALYLKAGTPKKERIKTIADGLIFSNILMILINLAAIHICAQAGLGMAVLLLAAAFAFIWRLPRVEEGPVTAVAQSGNSPTGIAGPLAFLCLFIMVITINSGLMYQVFCPAFSGIEWLTSWYWAIPYIVALAIMRNLSPRVNRTYILFVAIAMIGFSFIAFLLFDRSWGSYLVINTLMLGACGVYDLFWWSILGEMLDLGKNPAIVLGVGLAANVLGVLLGGLIGSAMAPPGGQAHHPALLAFGVVCVTLAMLPPLHKQLANILNNHAYLTKISEIPEHEQTRLVHDLKLVQKLTERENEITALLLTGKTYRMIAGELSLSENTIKTHVKNIYSKVGVQSRTELMNVLFGLRISSPDLSKEK